MRFNVAFSVALKQWDFVVRSPDYIYISNGASVHLVIMLDVIDRL